MPASRARVRPGGPPHVLGRKVGSPRGADAAQLRSDRSGRPGLGMRWRRRPGTIVRSPSGPTNTRHRPVACTGSVTSPCGDFGVRPPSAAARKGSSAGPIRPTSVTLVPRWSSQLAVLPAAPPPNTSIEAGVSDPAGQRTGKPGDDVRHHVAHADDVRVRAHVNGSRARRRRRPPGVRCHGRGPRSRPPTGRPSRDGRTRGGTE